MASRHGFAPAERFMAWFRRQAAGPSTEPGSAMFHVLRLRLALGFAGLLAVAMAVVGTALYFSLEARLLVPFQQILASQTGFVVDRGQRPEGVFRCPPRGGPPPGGGLPRPRNPFPVAVACYTADLQLVTVGYEPPDEPGAPDPLLYADRTLIASARERGRAVDQLTLADGDSFVRVARTALNADGTIGGIILATHEITLQRDTMTVVRNLLAGLSGVAILLSLAGGWVLARRALAPARLAFSRQQSFIADASHELRTPMALLRANAEVLLRHRDRFEPDDAELMEDIVAETDHMSRLTTDLLTLARLDANALELEPEVVDLGDLGERLARRVAAAAANKRVAVEVTPSPGILTMADADAIEQAGLILVENAVKYTLSGGTVSLRAERVGHEARLVVSDTGIGIPTQNLSRLGQRFYRVDGSRARETGGTGLGLAIAFRIATAHGGAVRLASEEGVGTTAELALRALEAA